MKYKKGSNQNVLFATTLNTPFDSANSFITVLANNPPAVDVACPAGDKDFVPCDFGPNLDGNIWYSRKLNALIYARDDINLEGTLGSRFLDWLRSLFGVEGGLSSEEAFVKNAHDFKDVYLSSFGSGNSLQKVRGVKEIFATQRTLIVEYENFDTPVCEYTPEGRIPIAGFDTNVWQAAEGTAKIVCTVDNTTHIQRVEAVPDSTEELLGDSNTPLDILFPQLTGKLRRG